VRGVKSTIALIAVLIGLVAYIYFVDAKKPASGAPETKAKAFAANQRRMKLDRDAIVARTLAKLSAPSGNGAHA